MPPGGTRSIETLRRALPERCLITSFDDSRLRLLKDQIRDDDDSLEFISFGEAIGRFLLCLGAPTGRMCTRGRETSLVSVWAADLGADSALGRSLRYPGAAEKVADVLHELRDWGWTADELRAACQSASPALQRRLVDIEFLESQIEDRLKGTSLRFAVDSARKCMALKAKCKLPYPDIVVLVGDEDRPVFEQWLLWAAEQGVRVTVALDASAAHPRMFSGAKRIAERLGVRWVDDHESHWTDALFNDRTASELPHVEFWHMPDRLAECETALRYCIKRQQEGVFPFRIGIYARDAELYAPLLITAAERLGVPLRANLTAPLMTNGFARLVLQTLEALASDDVRKLSRIAGSGYLGLSTAQRSELWSCLIQAYRAQQAQWTKLTEWAESAGEAYDWLRHILGWRAEVQEPCSLGGWLDRLRSLIGGTVFVDWAVDDSPTQTQDLYAQTVLHRSLAEHAFAYDSRMPQASLPEFAQVARRVWEQARSTQPGQDDGVVFVSNSSMLGELDTLYVLGLLEGIMPRRRSEDPLLSDDHRQELSDAAPHLTPLLTSRERILRERDEFLRLCATPTSQLVLSYPKTTDDQDNVPAFYMSEVRRALDGRYTELDLPRQRVVPEPAECVAPKDLDLALALFAPAHPAEVPELTIPALWARVRPEAGKPVFLEELRAARACLFQAAARHRLRLFRSRLRMTVHRMTNLPLDAGLASQPTPELANLALNDALEEFISTHWAALEAWEVKLLRFAGESLIQGWVEREFAARSLWRGDQPAERIKLTFDQLVESKRDSLAEEYAGVTSNALYGGSSFVGDMWVLHRYETSLPDYWKSKENQDRLDYYWMMAGILHKCRPRPGVQRVAFEFDAVNGVRQLLCIPRSMHLKSQSAFVVVTGIADDHDRERHTKAWKEVRGRWQEAKQRVEMSVMRPEPTKDACARCQYGELCRSSWEHMQVDTEEEA